MASAVLKELEERTAPRRSSAVFAAVKAYVRPHSAPLVSLVKMPLTVAGTVCIDTGVFLASAVAGWIITGISLIVLEYMIADES